MGEEGGVASKKWKTEAKRGVGSSAGLEGVVAGNSNFKI